MPRITDRLRPSPALVVACLALFVALGGVGYAAATIGSAQVRNNSLTGADIRNASIRTADLGKGAVTPAKLSAAAKSSLRGPAGAPGAPGAAGAAGTTGAKGDKGDRGDAGPSLVRTATSAGASLDTCTDLADCADIAPRSTGTGNWIVSAKLLVDNNDADVTGTGDFCALVNTATDATLDRIRIARLSVTGVGGESQAISLMATMANGALAPSVAVRCTEAAGETLQLEDVRVHAQQVGAINP